MNNFNLNALSVSEMNAAEMQQADGGFILAAACITLAALYLIRTCAGLASGGLTPDGR
jgi:hypothetical protein